MKSLKERLKLQPHQQQSHNSNSAQGDTGHNAAPNTRIETLQQALQASQMSVGKLHERIRELENELLNYNMKKQLNVELQQVKCSMLHIAS